MTSNRAVTIALADSSAVKRSISLASAAVMRQESGGWEPYRAPATSRRVAGLVVFTTAAPAPRAEHAEGHEPRDAGGGEPQHGGADQQPHRPPGQAREMGQQGSADPHRTRVHERREPRQVEPRPGDREGQI